MTAKINMYHLELPYEELGKILTEFGYEVNIIQHHQYIKVHSLDVDAVGKNLIAQCEVHEHPIH